MSLSKIGYVILFVKNPEASLAFYRDKLGCKVTSESPEWVEMDGGGVTLALHACGDKTEGLGAGLAEVVWNVDDVHAVHATLQDGGVKFVNEPHVVCEVPGGVGKAASFRDPDGHSLSVFGIVKNVKNA